MQDRDRDCSERTVGRTEQTGVVGGGTISVVLNGTISPALRAVISQRDVPTNTKWSAALGGVHKICSVKIPRGTLGYLSYLKHFLDMIGRRCTARGNESKVQCPKSFEYGVRNA